MPLSGELKNTDNVLIVNPVFNLRRQINSFSLVDHLEIHPALVVLTLVMSDPGPLQRQYAMLFKGQTSFKKLCKASVRPTKCFIRLESSTITSYDRLLTTLVTSLEFIAIATSFLNIIVFTLLASLCFETSVCVPLLFVLSESNSIWKYNGLSPSTWSEESSGSFTSFALHPCVLQLAPFALERLLSWLFLE